MLTSSVADAFCKEFAPVRRATPAASRPPWLEGRARELWDDESPPDASKHDAKFVLECLRLGVTEDDAWAAVPSLPGGKARRDGRVDASYRNSTLDWARRQYSVDEAALRLVKTVRRRSAHLKATSDALARVYDLDPYAFKKALARLKKKGIDVQRVRKEVQAARAILALPDWDNVARHAVAERKSAGWWYRGSCGWVDYSSSDWARNLTGGGMPPAVIAKALADRPWTLVAEPFQAEELDGRRWNMNAARFRHTSCAGPHPTWDQLLRVVGRGLDVAARMAGFESGGHYLFLWIASVAQRPFVKLPYLFFHGEEQNAGKSLFHEALATLLERGYVVANEALENTKGFNGELHGAVICAADEIELAKKAYKRIKQWTTGEFLLIHPKGKTAYQIRNTTHWVQTGNDRDDCPLLKGDTRITACHVWPADEQDRIPKDAMLDRLTAEGPAFVAALLATSLPGVVGRLGLPVLMTAEKQAQQQANRSRLVEWLDAHPEAVAWSDDELVNKFLDSLGGNHDWDRGKVLRGVPSGVQALQRLVRGVAELVSEKPWRGTVDELVDQLGTTTSGDWANPNALGIALGKGLPGFTIRKTRANGVRRVTISRG